MEISKYLDAREIIGAYRVDENNAATDYEDEQEQLPIADKKAFEANIIEVGEKCAMKFQQTLGANRKLYETPISERGLSDEENRMNMHGIEIAKEVIDPNIPFTMGVFQLLKLSYPSQKHPTVSFRLLTSGDAIAKEREIASLEATIDGNTFDIYHRIVERKFRGQKLGSFLLKSFEGFVQKIATATQQEKTCVIETGQIDVMCWLWNNGYEPATENDRERFEKVITKSPGLIIGLRNYVYEDSKMSKKLLPMERKSQELSYRITFTKKLKPGLPQDVIERLNTTGRAVREEISS